MHAERASETAFEADHYRIDCRGHVLDCRPGLKIGAHVMGILNVTPDSFSDGGRFTTVDAALRQVEAMISEGAAIIDVGGESSRPRGSVYGEGAESVPADEEIRRVVPMVESIAARFPEAVISVDTYKPRVARASLQAGAHIINDVTGLRYTADTAAIAASFGAPLIVMHSLGKPGNMPGDRAYDDVVAEVRGSLATSVDTAVEEGVKHVLVDPGFGFGKSPRENLRLIRDLQALAAFGRPVVIGVSRKSTIGAFLGTREHPAPLDERLFGTLGVTAVGVLGGASIVRTHDVAPTVDLLRLIGAVMNA